MRGPRAATPVRPVSFPLAGLPGAASAPVPPQLAVGPVVGSARTSSASEAASTDGWAQTFAPTGAAVVAAGVGRVELAAPFLPTIPGTDAYVDQLR